MATENKGLGLGPGRSGQFLSSNNQESHEETGDTYIDDCKKELNDKGVAGLKEKLKGDSNSWANIKLNIAVVGNSGTGKSSFINLLRGLKNSDSGAVKVGINETTVTCEVYDHPDNKNFLFWNIPSIGTSYFPKDTYLKQVQYDSYDLFIIVSKGRLTENDSWLAHEVQKQDKQCFFIRTNIDVDIRNDRHDNPDNHSEQDVIHSIRKKTEKELTVKNIKEPKVFLIDNHRREEFDFEKLNNELLASCYGLQKDAMALSLAAVTKEVMGKKKRVLEGRIPAIATDVTNAAPSEQTRIFQNEIRFYQEQFDIDNVTLAMNKDILTIPEHNGVEFDMCESRCLSIKTPTAQREEASTCDKIKDWFMRKDNKLLYTYCKQALQNNLDDSYSKACQLYDATWTKQIVHALAK